MIFGVVVLSLVIAEKRNSKARNIQPVKEPVNEENEGAEWTPAFFPSWRSCWHGSRNELSLITFISKQMESRVQSF